jgi:hypothetical protein
MKKNLYNLMFQIQHHVNSFLFGVLPSHSIDPAKISLCVQKLPSIFVFDPYKEEEKFFGDCEGYF